MKKQDKQAPLPSKQEFTKYVALMRSNKYNMKEETTRQICGLDPDIYHTCRQYYSDLIKIYGG